MDAKTNPSSAITKTAEARPSERAVVPCSEKPQTTSPVFPSPPRRPRTPNTDGESKLLIDENGVCNKEANGRTGLLPRSPQDSEVKREVEGRHLETDDPGHAPGTCRPAVHGADAKRNDVPVQNGPVPLKLDSVRLATGVTLGGRETDECATNKDGSRGSSAEGRGEEARESRSGIALGGSAGGTPTWVVKPAANSNCGFGIHICCSLKVTAAAAHVW